MFEQILLTNPQKDLFVDIVEAERRLSPDRRSFLTMNVYGSKTGYSIHHWGLPGQEIEGYEGDVFALAEARLIRMKPLGGLGGHQFDITPLGFKYYEWLKEQTGTPIQRVEVAVRHYLDADRFQREYAPAYVRWIEAENMLWSPDAETHLTDIGHRCREAFQEFGTVLVNQYPPPNVDMNKAHARARISAVLKERSEAVDEATAKFLEAMLGYLASVDVLNQRQEHGSQKEGTPLTWEDARRLVFQTMIVMHEVDRALQKRAG